MAKATVKRVANGKKNRQQIYCTTKSGNVYGLRTKVAVKQVGAMMQRIRKAGVINTTHWVKIKEGEKPQRKAAPKQPLLTRDQYLAKHGSLPADKSYSVTDKHGYPISMAQLMGVQA